MIALCAEHHRKADGGAFTLEQLRTLKRPAGIPVAGRFDWLRNDILAFVGGCFYYETPVIFQFKNEKAIWFERDADNNMLLNLRMLTQSGEPRLSLRNNDWLVLGTPLDFESPPSGKRIHARYANGDSLTVQFTELSDIDAARKRFGTEHDWGFAHVRFPITVVEVEELFGGSDLGFGPSWTRLPGGSLAGGFAIKCGCGISWS